MLFHVRTSVVCLSVVVRSEMTLEAGGGVPFHNGHSGGVFLPAPPVIIAEEFSPARPAGDIAPTWAGLFNLQAPAMAVVHGDHPCKRPTEVGMLRHRCH